MSPFHLARPSRILAEAPQAAITNNLFQLGENGGTLNLGGDGVLYGPSIMITAELSPNF
jgi:hypothetical protein